MDAMCLLAMVSELWRRHAGATVCAVRPAGPHGLWIEWASQEGVPPVLVTADEALPRLVVGAARPLRERLLSPLAGAAQKSLPGLRLAGVEHRGLDRVVTLRFGGPGTASSLALAAELFGARPNVVLVEAATGRILESARHPGNAEDRAPGPGSRYAPPPPPGKPDPRLLGDAATVAAILARAMAEGRPAAAALQHAFAGIPAFWAREIDARAPGAGPEEVAASMMRLWDVAAAGAGEAALVLDEEGRPIAASPIRLRHLAPERQRPMASLGEALETLAQAVRDRQGFAERQRELLRLVRRLTDRLASRREKLLAEAAEFARADDYQRMGEILAAQQAAVPRGASEVVLPDYAGKPGATLRIPLDPAVGPGANAERLFQAARRGRRGALRVAARLAETDRGLAQASALMLRLQGAAGPGDLEAAQRELETGPGRLGRGASAGRAPVRPAAPQGAGTPRAAGAAGARRRGEGPSPRRFVSSDGLPILVGRDNEGNDYLTLHIARSEDLWLHAEGFPGSHVVVRMQGREGGVPRRTLIEAAQLAAYYSQARSHGRVPVSYTLKKYVRKPRKSPPGLVTVTHEKSIIVKPDKELIARLAAGDA
jgi:predicted ribosome quality control (RQC) complex YloA/Tae2 family protein